VLEGFLHTFFDPRAYFTKVLELAQMFRSGFFLRRDSQLLLHSLGHELAQRDAALGSHRLRPAKGKIRDFEGRLH